jgi:hypothetical protein
LLRHRGAIAKGAAAAIRLPTQPARGIPGPSHARRIALAARSPILDHIEKTLADAYRKEIDQEENVWRSLPFFAATLALQLAALFQIIERLPTHASDAWWVAVACAAIAGFATVVAVGFLALSILPAKFRYIAPEPELLEYAEGLGQDERTAAPDAPVDALATLKTTLARQYAVATHNNRRINQRRGLWRSIAGLAMLASVLATLALVITVAVTYVPKIH